MSEEKFEEVKDNKKVDIDCDVKDGKAVERINPILHPIKAANAFRHNHPRICAGIELTTIVAALIYVYKKGYDANAKVFVMTPDSPDADHSAVNPETIETNSETTEVDPETIETSETVDVQ